MRKLRISDGSLEALKWLALVLMTLDHANKYIFMLKFPIMSELGRAAMPIFGFVLAYNLARPDALSRGIHTRAMKRLFGYGVIASIFYMPLVGQLPLNIMFTLLAVTGMIYLFERGKVWEAFLAECLFIASGYFVDYGWIGLAYCLSAYWYCKHQHYLALVTWISLILLVCAGNQNVWALLAIPMILLATSIEIRFPRHPLAFYRYYPIHFGVIFAVHQSLI